MGTGVKVTMTEIELSPGPGHYSKVEGIASKTFHHAAKFQDKSKHPVFGSDAGSMYNKTSNREFNTYNNTIGSDGGKDFQTAKKAARSSQKNFFSPATGAKSMMAETHLPFTRKKQPPMLMGKANLPPDIAALNLTGSITAAQRTNSGRSR